jgi:hypothetical protein
MDDKSIDQKTDAAALPCMILDHEFVSLVLRHHEPLPPTTFSMEASDEPIWLAIEAVRDTCAVAED